MADMLPIIENDTVPALASLLQEHKGQDVSVLDLRKINNWTDFFLIATVSSKTHMEGIERHIKDFCHERSIDLLGSSRKTRQPNTEGEDEWRLIDLGFAIIHLMTKKTRDFYDLERLWTPFSPRNAVNSDTSVRG